MTIAFGPYGRRTRFTGNSRHFMSKKKKVKHEACWLLYGEHETKFAAREKQEA
jgi:hypothetical protein